MDVDVYYEALNKEIIDVLHDAGLKINCWTVDKKEIAEQLAKWGVDYITSNILE
jgi:glycerophosphoryl diester phosphodiesterase